MTPRDDMIFSLSFSAIDLVEYLNSLPEFPNYKMMQDLERPIPYSTLDRRTYIAYLSISGDLFYENLSELM